MEARRLRRLIASGEAAPRDRDAYAAALAVLGFTHRAAAARTDFGVATEPSDTALSTNTLVRRADPARVRVYVSGRQPMPDEADREQLARGLGTADYSYGFAMRGFLAGLARIGVTFETIRHPEYIADIRARSDARINLHLGFHPPEHIRLLKGAYNILCFAWEFDRLRSPAEVTSPHAFADQATMLNRAQELWMPSAHGVAAVAPGVSVPVHHVPAPVLEHVASASRLRRPSPARLAALADGLARTTWQPLAMLPRVQGEMDRTAGLHRRPFPELLAALAPHGPPTLFITVLNVHDYRKQLRPLLEGFAAFARERPDALLLVKCSTPARDASINGLLMAEQMADIGERLRPLLSDRIWISDDALTRAEMVRLYDAGAFYVCTSHAEGQNLPLLEAMARGVVPISVDHTAMADYIRPDNAVPIRSEQRPFSIRLTRRYGLYGIHTHYSEAGDVRLALEAAMTLNPLDYAARSAAALATVRDNYGPAPLLAAVRQAITAARAHDAAHG